MSDEKVSPIGMKVIHDMHNHTKVFNEEGSIPLDTLSWYATCLGTCFGIIDMDEMTPYYDDILNFSRDHFPKYNFRLKFDDEDNHGPNKVWLMYKFNPEFQN
jgi:hypothetical protein